MSLIKELNALTEKLQDALDQVEQMKLVVESLEDQNKILRTKLSTEKIRGEGFESLSHLYDEGYHICHDYFAQRREEPCLFCLSFLYEEGYNGTNEGGVSSEIPFQHKNK